MTSVLRTPARLLEWGGGWLWAMSARGSCGSGQELPTMVWLPREQAGPLGCPEQRWEVTEGATWAS